MNRQTATILTIVTTVFCGCPGLGALCFGALSAVAGMTPGAEINIFGSNEPQSAILFGLGTACLGLLLVAIPIVIGLVTLRRKAESIPTTDEPMPPTTDEPLPPTA